MKYTIDDLRGKYIKVGTPECEIFMNACDMLGIRWADGESARNKHQDEECISLNHHATFLSFSDLSYYQSINHLDLFVPKTDAATRRVDWSKAPIEATHALRYIDGDIAFAVLVGDRYRTIDRLSDYFVVTDKLWQVIEARPVTDEIDDTVTQRGERYGLFADGAVIMQDLKAVMRATPGWERLTPSQREALEMIQHKIGRVLNGDPMYVENFTDIAGYAILVKDEMLHINGATDAKVTYVERTNGSWVELNKRTS